MKNYCTAFPDGEEGMCCKAHDIEYSTKGTLSRKEADKALYQCVKENGEPVKAALMYVGVRAFGWLFYKDKDVKG